MVNALLPPLFVQVALTLGIGLALGKNRVAAARSGAVKISEIAVNKDAWPEPVRRIGACYQNQFELPVLFYTLVAMALATGSADGVLAAGAWLFVASRLVHAFIFLGDNNVIRRFYAFAAGLLVLGLCWVWFAIRALAG